MCLGIRAWLGRERFGVCVTIKDKKAVTLYLKIERRATREGRKKEKAEVKW